MATRLERVVRILLLLQTGVPYNPLQLAQATGVHRRTIFRDIAALRALGIPVTFDPESARYSMHSQLGPELSLLTDEELGQLLLAACKSALPNEQMEAARRAIVKLVSRLPAHKQAEIMQLSEGVDRRGPSDEELAEITAALRDGRTLAAVRPTATNGSPMTLVPLRLTCTAHGWMLAARVGPGGKKTEFNLTTLRIVTRDEPPPRIHN